MRPLRLKIEINTREHFTVLGFISRQVTADNPWYSGEADITTFELDELLGTKLRALYQRRKGRDLFDLWLGIGRGMVDPQRVVTCFGEYMQREGHAVSRAQFEQNLHDKESDPAFLADIRPLLRADVEYEATTAIADIREVIIDKLPGAVRRVGHVIRQSSEPLAGFRLDDPALNCVEPPILHWRLPQQTRWHGYYRRAGVVVFLGWFKTCTTNCPK